MSDDQLIQERFREFYQQNYPRLLSFAASQAATPDYPAEDLLQDAFVRAWIRLDAANCDNWSAWLHTIIVNLRIDRYRERARKPQVLASDIATDEQAEIIANAVSEGPSPHELPERLGDAQLVQQALAGMKNAEQRRVLELYYFDTGNYPTLQKVAEAMKSSHDKVKKLHERAKNAIKHSLRHLAKEMNIPTERSKHET